MALLELIQDHLKLIAIDYKYEQQRAVRRLKTLVVSSIFFILAFSFLQVAIIGGLLKLGIPLGFVGLLLAVVYGVLGWVLFQKGGRRDSRMGSPFEASLEELKRSANWIKNSLF